MASENELKRQGRLLSYIENNEYYTTGTITATYCILEAQSELFVINARHIVH